MERLKKDDVANAYVKLQDVLREAESQSAIEFAHVLMMRIQELERFISEYSCDCYDECGNKKATKCDRCEILS